ncbi:MAG TPA: sensor histidine kinase [Anaerolineae bacterium]|nr:sensor histidine kinase [Anaerolineae bacterium]HIP73634.1 sensor histidine kinase [Anaerolineae bacterium]
MSTQPFAASAEEKELAARRILAVTEEELQQIVLDIHDGLVQQLFAAQTQVSAIRARRAAGQTVTEAEWDAHLEQLTAVLGQSLQEIREFLGAFRSPSFAQRDLADIIRGLARQHEAFTGCEVTLAIDDRPLPASLPVKIALYRICQEALSNAFRHGRTRQQWVSLTRENNWIRLEVQDKGQGFQPPPLAGDNATEREEHIGLRGMRDRVGLIGGQFRLDSAPGKGTRVIVRTPCDE